MADESVVADNSKTAEETAPKADEKDNSTETTETIEEVKSKLAKAEEVAKNYKVRAEKAEGKAKEAKSVQTAETKDGDLSQKDLIAIVKADVHDDDLERVKKFALVEGISITEALKNDDLKALLERRADIRKTAEAANTSSVRRTSSKVDDATLIAKASKGEIPEKGSAEAEQLFWARNGGKR